MGLEKRSFISEDWLSLWIGLFVFVFSLELFIGIDIQGWGVKSKTLVEISQSGITISKNYESLCFISLLILFMYASQTLFLLNSNKHSTNHI